MNLMRKSRLDMRKALAFLLVATMVFGPTSLAFADLSGLTVTPESQNITTGVANATFAITVTNDGKGTANGTVLSIEGNDLIKGFSSFDPPKLDLDRGLTDDVELTINTTNLAAGTYTFYVRADAPAIGRGSTRQKSSSAISTLITLTVVGSVPPEPDPDPDPDPLPVEPVLVYISATDVAEGSALSKSVLSGTFVDSSHAEVEVEGELVWKSPATIVTASGEFEWLFTPMDTVAYLPTTGKVFVTAYPPPTEPTTYHYVALGNSLVLGTTGISGTMNSYVHGIFAHLQTVYGAGNVTMTILAVDGDDSSDLLNHLNTTTYINEVSKADLITISIGGNNVMPAARDSSFWSIDEDMAREGTNRFLTEYPLILYRIRALNPDATIVSATLYNPYNSANQPRGYSGDTVLHQTAAIYISQINDLIRDPFDSNYRVAEIHDHFLSSFGSIGKMGDVTFFYPRYSVFTWWYVQYTRDPHLNQRGQDIMRDIHVNVIMASQAYIAPIRQYSLTAAA